MILRPLIWLQSMPGSECRFEDMTDQTDQPDRNKGEHDPSARGCALGGKYVKICKILVAVDGGLKF